MTHRAPVRAATGGVLLALALMLLPARVAQAQLATPVLVSPAEGSTVTTGTPTLSWQAVGGANTYAVDIADNSAYSGGQSSGSLRSATLSFTPPQPLAPDRFYYWRVKAFGTDGSSQAEGHFWLPPTLTAPSAGAVVAGRTPTLTWNSYKTGGLFADPSRTYQVQIAEDADFAIGALMVGDLLASTYTVPAGGLRFGVTYFWRVRVYSDDGMSAWSPPGHFTTPPAAAAAPDLVSPGDGDRLEVYYPTLSWTPVAEATSYTVHYTCPSCANANEKLASDLTTTSFMLNAFWGGDATANAASYRWWVEAKNATGSGLSPRWTFTTPPPTAPSAPVLQSPPDGSQVDGLTPALTWNATSYTKTYRVQVGTSFAAGGITGQVAGPTLPTSPDPPLPAYTYAPDEVSALSLDYDTTYYWQVSALTIGGIATKSEVWSFRTPAAPA